MSGFKKATKAQSKLRLGLIGPAGSGKTMTALRIARGLAGDGGRLAVIDTERGSASLYAGERGLEFDVMELESYEVERFLEGLREAAAAKVDVLIIDSLSHAWAGKGGILEFVDATKKRGGGGIDAWGKATPLHNQLRDAILGSPFHVIATMRSKVEYVVEKDDRSGKTSVRKVGLQPVQREGMEYEFDVVGDINAEHELVITKTRAAFLKDQIVREAGEELGRSLREWLDAGDAPAPRLKAAPAVDVPRLLTETSAAIARATPAQLERLRPKVEARIAAGELTADQGGMLLDQIDARRAAAEVAS
jgi:hypothetical protein